MNCKQDLTVDNDGKDQSRKKSGDVNKSKSELIDERRIKKRDMKKNDKQKF